jgi:hypothetical protein
MLGAQMMPKSYLKPPMGACCCLKQHEIAPKWPDGTYGFYDDAKTISGCPFGT